MAALSERDLRRILGDEAMNAAAEGPAVDIVKRAKERKDSLEDRKFTAFAAVLMGVALVCSALYTAKGTAFLVQNAVAGVMIVAGVLWYLAAVKLDRRLDG